MPKLVPTRWLSALMLSGFTATSVLIAPMAYAGPFDAPSTLPYQLPAFDQIKDSDYAPAFDTGMAQHKVDIEAIANATEAPSFANTIVALERSGQMLNRVATTFFNLTTTNSNAELDKLRAALAPKLSAHQDALLLNPALFARVQKLYDQRQQLGLDDESLRLLERYHTQFLRAGAALDAKGKARLVVINEKLSTLTNQFRQNVQDATKAGAIVVDKESNLAGLSGGQIAAAAEAAKARGIDGKWLLTLQNTTTQPLLAQLENRSLRERLYKASVERARGSNPPVIAEILSLRAERAALLGYPNHAAYVLADETAGNTTAVNQILADMGAAAVAASNAEAAEIQKLIDSSAKAKGSKPFAVQPWDWAFYQEAVKKAKYSFDESEVRPYFELNRVLEDGVFYAANKFFGLSFKERKDLPLYRKDVKIWEVFNEDGSPLGLFIGDFYARDFKQGGAWMNSYVDQSQLFGTLPVVGNHLNVSKPPEGEPTLLTFDETQTLFHEFGHALHGLLSKVQYPYLSGTSVPRDFVEYPSQFYEMWAEYPAVVANFAKHWQTGAPIPEALLGKIRAASKFNEGFSTGETTAAMVVDQYLHQLPAGKTPKAEEVMAFQARALKAAGMDTPYIPPRYFAPYFSHIFAGGYSAGYYAYLWTAVLAANTQQWVLDHGGLQRANGEFLRAKILSRGGTEDAGQLFREFYGKGPEVGPLAEKRGLKLGKPAAKTP